MNLKHLYYFWKTAKSGGVVRAGEALHVTPQTISTQIRLLEESLDTQLFARDGRALELTPAGQVALEYADEMFSLSAELEEALRHYPKGRPMEFRVGVSDAVPKSLAYRLLRPAVDPADPVRIICREARLERLLSELAIHKLDLVIADSPCRLAWMCGPTTTGWGRQASVSLPPAACWPCIRALWRTVAIFRRAWGACPCCCRGRARPFGAVWWIGWIVSACGPASSGSLTILP